MHKILQNFNASVSGRSGRLGSSHFLSENFMTSVIKLGLKMVIVPNVNCPIASAPIKYQPKPTLILGKKSFFYFSCSWQTLQWVSFHNSTSPISFPSNSHFIPTHPFAAYSFDSSQNNTSSFHQLHN
jgi:hypothetical protein